MSAFESSGLDISLQQTSDQKVAYVFVRIFGEVSVSVESIEKVQCSSERIELL